jgi:hypothetical protein
MVDLYYHDVSPRAYAKILRIDIFLQIILLKRVKVDSTTVVASTVTPESVGIYIYVCVCIENKSCVYLVILPSVSPIIIVINFTLRRKGCTLIPLRSNKPFLNYYRRITHTHIYISVD